MSVGAGVNVGGVEGIREAGCLLGESPAASGEEGSGRELRVVLIREGLAKSGRYFTRGFVEEVARAAEGLRAFADHPTPTEDRERPARSVRDVVGFYRDGGVAEDEERGKARAEATLHVFEPAAWLAAMAREWLACGYPEVIGLSIDAVARTRKGRVEGVAEPVVVAEGLVELRSVDVVTRASAGGRFLAVREGEGEMENADMEKETVMEGQTAVVTKESEAALAEAQRVLGEVREAQLAFACRQALAGRLEAESLPEPVLAKVREQWAYAPGRWGTAEEYERALEGALGMEREALERLQRLLAEEMDGEAEGGAARAGERKGAGRRSPVARHGGNGLEVTVSESERQLVVAQVGMDRLLGYEGGEDDQDWRRARELGVLAGLPRWGGIREAYVALTGDAAVTGSVVAESSIVREANEVTSGVLNHALLNSMTKRLVRDYRGQPREWRKFCSVVPLANFKSQDRVRLHDFSSLSTVAEGAAYTNLAWDDSREAYAPSKRGNLVVVTREAILNDDLRAIARIPQKLARAAHITINEFVYGLFTSNPTMADSTKVFDDGVQTSHGNRGTAVLSSSALQAAITSMMKQTDTAGKRLNLKPRYLLVPADLLFTALTIVNSTMVPGSANNDANVLRGAVEPVPVAQFTDATDWYLMCDPGDIESIEVGFVGGREEPELLMQEGPLLGQVFTNDQMSFKVRWEFGGAWLDYRGAFWSQAAG